MKKQIILIFSHLLFFNFILTAQPITVEGYVFQDNNRGFLNEVDVQIFNTTDESFVTKTITNLDGFFSVELPAGKDFILKINKDLFFPKEETTSTKGKATGEKVYLKVKLERKPGYIFDVTLAEKGAPKATVNAISGARIEVYNNTKLEETLVIDSLAAINFDVTFERGNHYTVLIRKEGFFSKRLEAYVDVEGCILCFEGVGTVTPGMSDVMSEGFQMGSVLANIELEPARLNEKIVIDNIYYDLDKYEIRKDAAAELEKVVKLLSDNPAVIIELGSHTDSRGGTRYNQQLSSRRAQAAVDYITNEGGISKTRIKAKGYGETELVNKCTDGAKCSEEEHQLNRRTELKIIGFEEVDPQMLNRTLSEMLTEERLLREIENAEQIQVKPGEVPPNFDKLEKTNQKPSKETGDKDKLKQKAESITDDAVKTPVRTAVKEVTVAKEKLTSVNTEITAKGMMEIPPYEADQVLIIRDGQIKFLSKMIDTQLNTEITDLLIGKSAFLESKDMSVMFNVTDINSMPPPLLNAFLKKVAMMQKEDGWHLYTIEKGEAIPDDILKALK